MLYTLSAHVQFIYSRTLTVDSILRRLVLQNLRLGNAIVEDTIFISTMPKAIPL